MHRSCMKFEERARSLGISVSTLELEISARTAHDAARAVGCDVRHIVKTLIFLIDNAAVAVLMSGHLSVDVEKLAQKAGVALYQVVRPAAKAVKKKTGYSIGGVPPFGHDNPLPVLLDSTLLELDLVWAAAGTPFSVFPISPRALVHATSATVVDVAADPAPARQDHG